MLPALKNNIAAGYQGPAKIELFEGCRSFATFTHTSFMCVCVFFGRIRKRICDLRSFGSCRIKGTDESTLDKDSSVPLIIVTML